MSLGKVEFDIETAITKFDSQLPSAISHHGSRCCDIAKSWFLAMDKSHLAPNGTSLMPIWIQEKYKWGPSKWPIYWCEAIESEFLDCGAQAALYHESIRGRGVNTLLTQLVLWHTQQDCAHWNKMWEQKGVTCNWITSPFVYHEVCAVLFDGQRTPQILDPQNNCWIDPNQGFGYKRPVAIRVFSHQHSNIVWGRTEIECNKWVNLFTPHAG